MQIIINRQDLLTVLKRTSPAINAGDMLSIRQAVLIVADSSGSLTFGATNGPLGITCLAKSESKSAGRALLNHHGLMSRVNELPDGHIEVTVDEKFRVTLRSSASKRKLTMTGLAPEDFPNLLAEKPGEPLFSVEAKILQQAAGEVDFVIDKDRIAGALLAPGADKQFHLVTMGARGMAVATGWFTERLAGGAGDIILPKILLDAIDSVDPKAILTLSTDTNNIFLVTDGIMIRAGQLQARMPALFTDVLKAAPTERRFRVSSEALLSSVKAVAVAADYVEGTERFIQIDIACTEGLVTVATRRSERSYGEDELAVTDAAPGSFLFHIDATKLSTALRSFAPAELDLYYDVVLGQSALFLKNETLSVMMSLIGKVQAAPPKEKK